MPLYRSGPTTIFFIHVPKTGGTSIEDALTSLGAIQAFKSPRRTGIARKDKLMRISFQHIHHSILDEIVPEAFYDYSFAVVRNPISRALSSYRWNTRNRKSPPSFDRWFLEAAWKYRTRLYYADNHLRPQSDFVGPSAEVFRFEDGLEQPVRAASERLGLRWTAGRLPHEKRTSAARTVKIHADTMARLRRLYADDFNRFGYDASEVPGDVEVVEGRHPLSLIL